MDSRQQLKPKSQVWKTYFQVSLHWQKNFLWKKFRSTTIIMAMTFWGKTHHSKYHKMTVWLFQQFQHSNYYFQSYSIFDEVLNLVFKKFCNWFVLDKLFIKTYKKYKKIILSRLCRTKTVYYFIFYVQRTM